jgi:hypothetical protein
MYVIGTAFGLCIYTWVLSISRPPFPPPFASSISSRISRMSTPASLLWIPLSCPPFSEMILLISVYYYIFPSNLQCFSVCFQHPTHTIYTVAVTCVLTALQVCNIYNLTYLLNVSPPPLHNRFILIEIGKMSKLWLFIFLSFYFVYFLNISARGSGVLDLRSGSGDA